MHFKCLCSKLFRILLLFMLLRFPVQIVGCRVEEYVMYTVKNSIVLNSLLSYYFSFVFITGAKHAIDEILAWIRTLLCKFQPSFHL